MFKNLVLWLVIALVLMSVFSNFGPPPKQVEKLPYSQFVEKARAGGIKQIVVEDRNIRGSTQDDKPFVTFVPSLSESVINTLVDHGSIVYGKAPDQPSLLMNIFVSWFPIILFIGVFL